MNLTLGTTLKNAEKHFGPCLPGMADPARTASAVRYAAGKGKKFAGVPGIHPDAVFYVHFPVALHLASIKSKKGTIDFINDLKQDGPQAKQGRETEVEAFLHVHRQKEAAQKKAQMFDRLCGIKPVVIEIDGQRFEVQASITFAKKTKKIKVVAQFSV